jgi:hypothetical protein
VKIRLIAPLAECTAMVALLRAVTGLRITSASAPYPSRRNPDHVLLYLTCDLLEPASEGDPRQ